MKDEFRETFEEDDFYRKGTYNGIEGWFRKEDGYVNATRIDPLIRNYFFQKEWSKTVEYWQKNEQKSRCWDSSGGKIEDIPKASYVFEGGNDKQHQGTFVHHGLIHFVAQWHSIEYSFAVEHVMNAINEISNAKHQEFEKTTQEIIERLTQEKEEAIREKEEALKEKEEALRQNEEATKTIEEKVQIIHDAGVPSETAGPTLKMYPDKVQGYFKISANNNPSKIPNHTKKFTFPSSTHGKFAAKKFFGI
jgi:hypothetical protein